MDSSSREGLVLRIDAKVCHVEIDGVRHTLPLRGRLFEDRTAEKRPIAVGDRVLVRLEAGSGAIEAVLPRTTQLHRQSASEGEHRAQVLAANISLVLVVAAVAEPPLQPELIDALLVAAGRAEIPAALVFTKIDRDARGQAQQWGEIYRQLGYRVLLTCTEPGRETTAELAELAELLHHNRTVLCGLSGVGKSTLLNRVIPGLDLRIGSLNHVRQGKHTTTHTELIPLPGGGHVLDTPGIRSFLLFRVGSQELSFLFPEIRAALPQCEYTSCLHLEEPGCAVRKALAAGTIAKTRYASYCVMAQAALKGERPAARSAERGGGRTGRRPRPR